MRNAENPECKVTFSSGNFHYQLERNWAKWPTDMGNGAVCGIACTADGKVMVSTRSEKYPICVMNDSGEVVNCFGRELDFSRTHGLTVEEDGTIWCCDDQNSVVYHLDLDGSLLQMMGEKGHFSDSGYDPSVRWPHDLYTNVRAAEPFNRPTRMARSPWGDYYCTDGYGNTAVHRFDGKRNLVRTWGGPGRENGKFRLPHSLAFDEKERIWVCDRENFRVQIFDKAGNFLHSLERQGYASDICQFEGYMFLCDGDGQIRIYDMDMQMVGVIGYAGCFPMIHSIAVDHKGNLYLGRICNEDSLFRLKRKKRD